MPISLLWGRKIGESKCHERINQEENFIVNILIKIKLKSEITNNMTIVALVLEREKISERKRGEREREGKKS